MNVNDVWALDIETAPTTRTENPYALEAFRLRQGRAHITCVTATNGKETITLEHKDGRLWTDLTRLLKRLKGEIVVCHYAIFDVSWMYTLIGDYDVINGIKWADSQLLSKWYSNGQEAEAARISHSLINSCNRHLGDHELLEEFNDVKGQAVTPGDDYEYWLKRNVLDTTMTRDLFVCIWKKLPVTMRKGFLIEQACIAPICKGYVRGIPFDSREAQALDAEYEAQKTAICNSLGVPVKLLTSPKQKQALIFDNWGMEASTLTPKGVPSTAHDVLMRLHQSSGDPRLSELMDAVKFATLQSKYTKGFKRVTDYVGEQVLYGNPRIFGAYTGRMTYSSKTTKKGSNQCSIAMHQLPRRNKEIKHLLKAPDGMGVIAIDANSQETRVMAIKSGDRSMLNAYQKGMDLHSVMTSTIYGRPYQEVVEGNKRGIPEIVEERQSGKLLNLSCQYRIGAKALADKFFATYGQNISLSTARRYLGTYRRQYPGVIRYWDNSIMSARAV